MEALEFLTKNNFDCRLSPDGIVIKTEDEGQASLLAEQFFDDFALTAFKCGSRVQITWGANPNFNIEIHKWMYKPNYQRGEQEMINNNLLLPQVGLYLGEVQIHTPKFLSTLINLLEHKTERFALVRVSDNLQIAVTAGMVEHLGTVDLQPNTRVKREEYWLGEDLHEFNKTWKRELSENGELEFSYRALTNSIVSKEDWSKFTTRYRLFQDGNEYYHMAEILAVEPIASPVRV